MYTTYYWYLLHTTLKNQATMHSGVGYHVAIISLIPEGNEVQEIKKK